MMNIRRRKAIADLNITNLVDVVFTLLIIFMITAPMMTQGVQVDLPKAEAENVEVNDYIQVSINGRNEIFIDQERINLVDFKKRFRQVFASRIKTPVFIMFAGGDGFSCWLSGRRCTILGVARLRIASVTPELAVRRDDTCCVADPR